MGGCSIYALLEQNTRIHSEKIAIITEEERLTYEELGIVINRLSDSLKQNGVKPGTTVGIILPNSAAFVEVFYAVQKLGAIVVPINTRFTKTEFAECIRVTRCEIVIYDSIIAVLIEEIKRVSGGVKTWIGFGESILTGDLILQELIASGNEDFVAVADLVDDSPAMVICTSGTTGLPKAVVHTKGSAFMRFVISELSVSPICSCDTYLNYAHLSHLSGLGRLISALSKGASMILLNRISARILLEMIDREKPNCVLLVPPSFLYRIREENESMQVDLSCVTRIETGSTILFPQTIEAMFETFPRARLFLGYGQSECYPITNFSLSWEEYKANPQLINSCGKVAAYTQIRIVDEDGRDLPEGEFGEVLVKSPAQMCGYLGEPSLEGWLETGDYLRVDKDGYYYFVDRKKDIIKSRAEYVSSVEVEKHILKHPNVQQCAVIGHVSASRGEIVVAAVVMETDVEIKEADIIDFCKRELAFFKVPKKVFFIDELPVTSTGKVDKVRLKRELLDGTKNYSITDK